MPRKMSRPDRWSETAAKCGEIRDKIAELANDLADELTDLYDIQQEYQDWRDNLPENMESSSVAEKLDAVLELTLDNNGCAEDVLSDWSSVSDAIDEAAGIELPLGYGRD